MSKVLLPVVLGVVLLGALGVLAFLALRPPPPPPREGAGEQIGKGVDSILGGVASLWSS